MRLSLFRFFLRETTASGPFFGPQGPDLSPAKPLEEFYDTHADPFEIHNLASDPRYLGKIAQMRAALDRWITECKDPLDLPEDDLVRSCVYPPDGRQPTTAAPAVRIDPAGMGADRLTITCATEGASIGFGLWRANETRPAREDRGDAWAIYHRPVEIQPDDVIEVVAHRIGFKPSQVIVVRPSGK